MEGGQRQCKRCGAAVAEGAEFCPQCGARQSWPSASQTLKKVILALFLLGLALALGLLGSCLGFAGVMIIGESSSITNRSQNAAMGAAFLGGGFLAIAAAVWLFIRMIKLSSRN